MNTLSIFIYLTQVLTNLHMVIGFLLLIGFSSAVIILFAWILMADHYGFKPACDFYKPWLARWLVPMSIITIIHVVLPSRETAILIASSEVGEKIVTSDKVSTVVDPGVKLLKTWIEKETNDLQSSISKDKKQ